MSGPGAEHPGEFLSAYLDGEITSDEFHVVTEHLESCGRCKSELDELAVTRAAIRGLPLIQVPNQILVLAGPSSNGRSTAVDSRRDHPRWLPRPLAWAGAAAAVAVLIVAGALVSPSTPQTLSPQDLSAPYMARSSVEGGLVPLKVVMPQSATSMATP